MKRLPFILSLLLIAEVIGCALIVGLRLNSTTMMPRLVEQTHDTLTTAELAALPRRFLTDSVQKWQTVGEAYLITGHFSTAEACFRQAVKQNPGSARLSYLHGMSLERLGQSQAAVDAYRRAADAGSAELKSLALYCLGRTYLRLEQPDDASSAFAEAGDDDRCTYQRAKLFIRNGESDAARPLVHSLVKDRPTDLHVWRLMEQLADLDDDARAAATARDWRDRSVRSLDLDVIETYYKANRDRIGLGREIDAHRPRGSGKEGPQDMFMTHVVSHDTRWQNTFLLLLETAAIAEFQSGNLKEARALIHRQMEQEDFPTAGASELLGDIESTENHIEKAVASWERAARMLPGPSPHLKLAGRAEIQGDRTTQRHRKGLVGLHRGLELFRGNKLAEARATFQQTTINASSDIHDLWFYLGETERLLGNASKARAAYTRCLKLNPDHGRALTAIERLEDR